MSPSDYHECYDLELDEIIELLKLNITSEPDVPRDYYEHIDNFLIFVMSPTTEQFRFRYLEHQIYCRVYLTDTMRLQKIEVEEAILLQMDDDKKLVALLFRNENDRMAKEFLKEDRERLSKESKSRSLALRKSLKLSESNSNVKSNRCCMTL
nr:15362_t:CDS:2 [Entrophospora candida]